MKYLSGTKGEQNEYKRYITDLIHDVGGNDGLDGFNFTDDDGLYDTFENIDFTEVQV